jgi:hypothetical protein
MTAPFQSQQRYGDAFTTLVKAYSNTLTLRRVAELGQDVAQQRVAEGNPRHIPDERMADLIMSFREEQVFATRRELDEFLGGPPHVAESMTPMIAAARVSTAGEAINSASLVFMYSAFEGALASLSKLSKELRADVWRSLPRNRRRGAEIIDRIERLTAACGPVDNFDPVLGFTLDTRQIERMDGIRNAIIHKRGATYRDFLTIENDLWYLAAAGLYYCGLVSRTHGVLINWKPPNAGHFDPV